MAEKGLRVYTPQRKTSCTPPTDTFPQGTTEEKSAILGEGQDPATRPKERRARDAGPDEGPKKRRENE